MPDLGAHLPIQRRHRLYALGMAAALAGALACWVGFGLSVATISPIAAVLLGGLPIVWSLHV